MKVQVERDEVIKWLRDGRCPACGFTFAACTCGSMVQMLLYIWVERERDYAHLDFLYIDAEESLSDWKAAAEALEAEAAALREREREKK